jgi:eukaryotic-like serine/threonine-protein kinase
VSLALATNDPIVGSVLSDRYRIVRVIGQGGMGVVYEAEHIQLNKRVAIKMLLAKLAHDSEAVQRFQREALAVSQIGNPHIIAVTDIGATPDGRTFVVLELLVGSDLGKALQAGPMQAQRAIAIMQQVLQGVAAAHAQGIVHRDLKPDNVFLVQNLNAAAPEEDFVKILDFGISKIIDGETNVRLTTTGNVIGTPLYMAPEQAMGADVDHRADLYSLGVMFYEMLAGRPPFDAPNYVALATMHLHQEPPKLSLFRPDLPTWLVAVVHRALEKEPARRFGSAEDFLAALPSKRALFSVASIATERSEAVSASSHQPPVATALSPPARPLVPQLAAPASSNKKSDIKWIGLVLAGLAAGVALLFAVVWQSSPTRSRERAPTVATAKDPEIKKDNIVAVPLPPLTQTAPALQPSPVATPKPKPKSVVAPVVEPTVGFLTITATPVCDVLIDGKSIAARTPVKKLELAPGHHAVTLINEEHGIKETSDVMIEAGKDTSLRQSFALRKPATPTKNADRDATINPFTPRTP